MTLSPPSSARHRFEPAELVAEALRVPEVAFVRLYGDSPFLAVKITDGLEELAQGLDATLRDVPTTSAQPIRAMEFNTQVESVEAAGATVARAAMGTRGPRGGASPGAGPSLAAAPQYILQLRKRAGVDAAFADRISLGRAPNKDIVLRHASISKSHAWFQLDEVGTVYVVDAGSKNGTELDGKRLAPREPVELHSGARIRFGSIETVLCDAGMLWAAIHET